MRVLFIHIISLSCMVLFSSLAMGVNPPDAADDKQQTVVNSFTVTVKEGGSFRIIAGEKIILRPGTQIVAGGSFHASISGSDIESIKKKEKERPLEVTRDEKEKVEEHSRLEEAYEMFRPFTRQVSENFREEKQERESINLSSPGSYGIASDQQRRIDADLLKPIVISTIHITSNISSCQIMSGFKPVSFMALRL